MKYYFIAQDSDDKPNFIPAKKMKGKFIMLEIKDYTCEHIDILVNHAKKALEK